VNATLGEFLDLARRHAAAAEDAPVERPGDLTVGVLLELRQLTAVMTSYLDDAVRDAGLTPGRPTPPAERSVLQQRHYLREASRLLSLSWPGAPPPLRPRLRAADGNAQAQGLARATDALTAGRELMLSHYEPAPWAGLAARSRWAPALASEPVILAVSAEMGRWSQVAASWSRWLAAISPWHDGGTREALTHAATMLQAAATVPAVTARRRPEAAFEEELLRAIPHHAPPQPLPPHPAEGHAALCAGIIASAERLRAAASAPPWHRHLGSGPAWLRSSQACAAIFDLASRALPMLADRAAHASVPLPEARELGEALTTLAGARDAWRALTRCWRVITTDTQDPASPFTGDTADLVVRLGRLVSGNPRWTPDWQQAPADAARLAPDGQGLRLALAAIHHAVDAIECVARADLHGVQSAAKAGRLYMPSNIVGGIALEKRLYLKAPADRAYLLQCACQAAIDTTTNAARMLDDLAVQCASPSKPLALVRKVTAISPDKTLQAPPAILAAALRELDRTPGSQRERAKADHHAIITAYTDNGMTIQQISWLWPVHMRRVAAILRENGIPFWHDREPASRDTAPGDQLAASRQRRTTAPQPDARTGVGRRPRSDAGVRQPPPAQPTAAPSIQPPHAAPPSTRRQSGTTPRA
jgi:hypothetical protein